jgi:hypothetical protein
MSTICFDIKRVDDDYVCIHHCDTNTFGYEYHLPLSFYPRKRKGEDHWWLVDKKYRYVWIVVGRDNITNIDRIFWACNDKIWLNNTIRSFKEDWKRFYTNIRIIKLPFQIKEKYEYDHKEYTRFVTSDLKDRFKIYCPVALNEKYHIYTDHYEEDEFIEEKIGETIFMTKTYKWIPPKQLEM